MDHTIGLSILLVFALVCSDSVRAQAVKPLEGVDESKIDLGLYILEKNLFSVESYDPKTKLYHLKRSNYPKADRLFATPKNLAKAVHSLKLSDLLANPESVLGMVYSTDQDLELELGPFDSKASGSATKKPKKPGHAN